MTDSCWEKAYAPGVKALEAPVKVTGGWKWCSGAGTRQREAWLDVFESPKGGGEVTYLLVPT